MHNAESDRRRVPRAQVTDIELSVLAFPLPARLLDISLSGVLIETTHAVELGTHGTLRFNFGGEPFSAAVTVARVDRAARGGIDRFAIGAAFIRLSRQEQHVIERFANQ